MQNKVSQWSYLWVERPIGKCREEAEQSYRSEETKLIMSGARMSEQRRAGQLVLS